MPRVKTVEVFFDGDCPLCVREIRMLQRLDRADRIGFIDITEPDFDPASVGVSWSELMDRIHGRLPDGTLIEGVEVFRRLYAAVGFGPLVALTRLPGVRQLLDFGYHHFAKNRLRLTGRCVDDVCALPHAQAKANWSGPLQARLEPPLARPRLARKRSRRLGQVP